jgi:hypothetical protein
VKYAYIGSAGLSLSYKDTKVADTDILTDDKEEMQARLKQAGCFSDRKVEVFQAEGPLLDLLYNSLPANIPSFGTGIGGEQLLTPGILLTLKLSHLTYDIRWKKHAEQAVWMLEQGIFPTSPLYDKLAVYWEERHGKKRANLMKSNDDFFKNGVTYTYVHDSLHEAISHPNRPLYEKCKPDLTKAYLSGKLFEGMPESEKLKLCREEIYVTALERFLVPTHFKMDPVIANRRAIHRLCVSMTKGWFPKYILCNLDKLWSPVDDYVALFRRGLKLGIIQPIGG